MANAITIQLRPTRSYSAPSVANLIHNAGLAKATYWIKEGSNLQQNIAVKNVANAVDLWRKWIEEARKLVLQNKGKNPKSNQVLIEEGLMVIGKDVLEKKHKVFVKIFEEFAEWFEQEYNTKILHFAFHNHEGHITENGDFMENLHIHFMFRNVDNIGESVRRKIKKAELSSWQTKIHEIAQKYIPKIERATNYFERGEKAPKHKTHRQHRLLKQQEQLLHNAAKVKDLQEENKKLREQLKQAHAQREHYAQLEQFVKQLKEQVKTKELTIAQLKEQMQQMQEQLLSQLREKDRQIAQLQEENKALQQQVTTLQNAPKPAPQVIVKEDTSKIEQLQQELREEKSKNAELAGLLKKQEEEIERLKAELDKLKQLRYIERKKHQEEIQELREQLREAKENYSKIQDQSSYIGQLIARYTQLIDYLDNSADLPLEEEIKINQELDKIEEILKQQGISIAYNPPSQQKRKKRNINISKGLSL